ncbi:MAG: thymidine phosphorylase [Alphaproteobacteria bacterium]|nr:thymidine phosphorylase [Alphaproteobacteria bacterium]
MLPQEIIRIKRDKEILSTEQIREFIADISNHKVDDVQIAAMTMAIFLNGLNRQETIDLTLSMRDSGDVLDWVDFDKPIVDKHSSGGVGDKVSLMLAPVLAACDVYVPMIAGRGLGHTGGTIDKLEAIPNYNTCADNTLFRKTVKQVGCAIIGQTGNLAPADKKIYAIRDVCGTVESIPLITASILSKKLAAGLQYLVMDLKCGNGAFMKNFEDAKTLAQSIIDVANGAGTKARAVLTDMNQVLGTTAGNAVEVQEAIEYLQGVNINPRLDKVTRELCIEILMLCHRCETASEANKLISDVLSSGNAAEKFSQMVASLGGPTDFIEHSEKYLPQASHTQAIYPLESGYVSAMDARTVGLSIIELGGGRSIPTQTLDLATGYSEFAQIGDFVDEQTPIAIAHYQTKEQFERAQNAVRKAVIISDKQPALHNPIMLKMQIP